MSGAGTAGVRRVGSRISGIAGCRCSRRHRHLVLAGLVSDVSVMAADSGRGDNDLEELPPG